MFIGGEFGDRGIIGFWFMSIFCLGPEFLVLRSMTGVDGCNTRSLVGF